MFDILVLRIAPCTCPFSLVADICCYLRIKQPERNVHTLDLIDMIFIFEKSRHKLFTVNMPLQRFFCLVFIKLERYDAVRL